MNCNDIRKLLNAYVDGELDSPAASPSRAMSNMRIMSGRIWKVCVALVRR